MYVFGILAMLALGVLAISMFADRFLAVAHEFRAAALVGVGIALAWLADFDMWTLWGIEVRESWIGVTLTGLAVGGAAYLWQNLLRLLAGLSRKLTDEAQRIEKTENLRRIA